MPSSYSFSHAENNGNFYISSFVTMSLLSIYIVDQMTIVNNLNNMRALRIWNQPLSHRQNMKQGQLLN